MKEKMILQFSESEAELGSLKKVAKNAWKEAGYRVKDISSVNFYIKPHENKCYFVINNEFNGSTDLF